MTAKEMFEKLGYKKDNRYTQTIVYKLVENVVLNDGKNIKFGVNRYISFDFAPIINVELYQAITQQMKELGWIE